MRSLTWLLVACLAAVPARGALPAKVADIDLSKPFDTRSPWRLSITQDPPVAGATDGGDNELPGRIRPCLSKDGTTSCDAELKDMVGSPSDSAFATPYYLVAARIVRATGSEPLLLIELGSMHGGNGDQLVLTQLLAYRPGVDRFARVYDHVVGRNNNQEVRYIESGPLAGDVVSTEPTADAPYGFWVTVSTLAPGGSFRQVLRYRSATRYGDGNPLPAIDSEMPNILGHLGLWHAGMPLPLPAAPCRRPHLVRTELWCE